MQIKFFSVIGSFKVFTVEKEILKYAYWTELKKHHIQPRIQGGVGAVQMSPKKICALRAPEKGATRGKLAKMLPIFQFCLSI